MADKYDITFDDEPSSPSAKPDKYDITFDDAPTIPAPKGDVARPALTRIPTPPLPDNKPTRDYGTGETALMYGARGAAGRWPEKAAAALTATFGGGPEQSWGERYDAAMDSTTSRYDNAANQNPVTAGLSEVGGAALMGAATGGVGSGRSVGTVLAKEGSKAALKEVGKRAAANALVSAVQGASYGNTAGEKLAGAEVSGLVGAGLSAAADAVAPAGAGRSLRALMAVLRKTPALVGGYSAYDTLTDPNATGAQQVASFAQAASPLASWLAKKPAGKRAEFEGKYDRALSQVERDAAEKSRAQQWADEDLALKERRNAEDRAHAEALAREAEQRRREDLGRTKQYAEQDINAEQEALAAQQQRHQERLTDKERQVRLAEKRAEQETLQNQWRQKQHQYRQEDLQTRGARAMEDYDIVTRRTEADQARRDARLALFDAETEFGKEMRSHEQAKAQYDADMQAFKAGQKSQADALASAKRLGDEKQRLIDAHNREEAKLLNEVPSMEEALASARGEYGQFHGEMLTRLANYLFGARETGQEPNPELVDVLARLVSKREELTKTPGPDGRPSKLPKIIDMLNREEGWINDRAEQIRAKAQAQADTALESRPTPDFDRQAAENLANRSKLSPAARAQLEQVWRDAGVDPTGKSDAEIQLPWSADAEPTAPVAPDRSMLDDASRTQRRAEMSQPAVAHTLGAERRFEDAAKQSARLEERGAPVARDSAVEAAAQRRVELMRLKQQGAPTQAGKASRRLERALTGLERLDNAEDRSPFRFDRRDEDIARARARENAGDAVPDAYAEAEALRLIREKRGQMLEAARDRNGDTFAPPDLIGEYLSTKYSPGDYLRRSRLGRLLSKNDDGSLLDALTTKKGRGNDLTEFTDPESAAALTGDLKQFGGEYVPSLYNAGRGSQASYSVETLKRLMELKAQQRKREEEEAQR